MNEHEQKRDVHCALHRNIMIRKCSFLPNVPMQVALRCVSFIGFTLVFDENEDALECDAFLSSHLLYVSLYIAFAYCEQLTVSHVEVT